ncbi:hypothetical protein [Neorhizobium sp. T25_27]|uniref:hypothetical protein n=1 Tax=Neorhizobium sp. T25_27 TaxID=2093831 RepID=UPI000CF8B6F7|nr:hypothetical protein [Neorhizobium sp. T25_27]
MIYLICQNSGNVWVSAESIQVAVGKVGEIGGTDYEYFDVAECDWRNSVEAGRRWYFSVYKSDDEFAPDNAKELAEDGEFLGYIALVERERAE